MSDATMIRVVGARQHNLKGVSVTIPKRTLTVITGPSGSGKSSLAFDTIYAEGQRRYVESLSAYARQFLEQMQKPDAERIEGLTPTLAIEQRGNAPGPRSTVATTTEVYDFLRVLFARAGQPTCRLCGRLITRQTTAQVVDAVLAAPTGQRILVLAPIVDNKRGGHKAILQEVVKEGFIRARVNGDIVLLDDLPPLAPSKRHTIDVVVDRLVVKPAIEKRLADSVELATNLAGGRVMIASETDDGTWISEGYSAALCCPTHPEVRLDDPTPQLFSFNAPSGACAHCHGLGTTQEFDLDLVVPDPSVSLKDGAVAAWRSAGRQGGVGYAERIDTYCRHFGVLPDIPFRNIPERLCRILMQGTTPDDVKKFGHDFEGVIPDLAKRWAGAGTEAAKQRLHAFLGEAPCESCHGRRLTEDALCVKIDGKSISDVTTLSIKEAAKLFAHLTFDGEAKTVADPLLREIRQRLDFLCDVGVDYLTLDRPSATLSGGEWQRIRLATQIGSGLAGVTYVLDEPTIGLHPRDSRRLTDILKRLADMENTVIVVEHDDEVISAASHMIDIGPGAGDEGGYVVAEGTLQEVLAEEKSITAKFLTGASAVALPEHRRPIDPKRIVELRGVTANNLADINVQFPVGCFVAVTGVSGSGKSTLVNQVLLRVLTRRIKRSGPRPGDFHRIVGSEHVDKVIQIDQAPIGRTPRSNPATYTGVFDLIRQLYAKTREAKIRGYGPPRFSFNVKGGRCDLCEGQGTKRIAMHFLPDVYVTCEACGGTRYNRETLEVRYRGQSIADVLNMRISEATTFFDNFANIKTRLSALRDVGLGYMMLGQSSNTLSGGEAQRVKLAAELHRNAMEHTFYILDEPTTGLHFADVRNLLTVLNRIVDRGHTVIVIEHNLDVIKVADWVIDLGPEGGESGGRLVVAGTPEQVADHAESRTGKFLASRLAGLPPIG